MLKHWLIGAVTMGILATALAWFGGPRPAQLGDQDTGDTALAASVRDAAGDPKGYRGLAVALIEHGTVRTAGIGDRGAGPVHPDTPFEVGSIGKALTGLLLAELAEDGTVDPDEPLSDLLPGIEFTDEAVAGTTLAELASHRAGLPSLRITGFREALGMNLRTMRGGDPYAGQDAQWLRGTVPDARRSAGEATVEYSNYGFAVLGHALAERAGQPYPELLRQRILAPLGMSDTGFHLDGAGLPDGRADGTTANGRPMAPWQASGYAPAGIGAWSTAEDLARLVKAMLAGTAPGADAATPRFQESADTRIGYGWFTTQVDGQEVTWHNGGTGGFRSFIGFDPEAGRGVVVLGNTDRWVDDVGFRLLAGTGDADAVDAGNGNGNGLGLVLVLVTLVVTLAGGVGLLATALRPRMDRLQLVSWVLLTGAMLAVTYRTGAWAAVPPWVWAAGVGLAVTAAGLALRRWRAVPIHHGSHQWWGWTNTALSALLAAGLLGWTYA